MMPPPPRERCPGRRSWRPPPLRRHPVLSVAGRRVRPVAGIGTFTFTAPLWRYPGADGWHFVSLPAGISADISDITAGTRRGFGSVRVTVPVGATPWRAAAFPGQRGRRHPAPAENGRGVAE